MAEELLALYIGTCRTEWKKGSGLEVRDGNQQARNTDGRSGILIGPTIKAALVGNSQSKHMRCGVGLRK